MTWRDRIKVHPAAELFPMMSDDELKALAADIDEHGLQRGVVSYRDANGGLVLLDGRNRLEAIERFSERFTLGEAGEILFLVDEHDGIAKRVGYEDEVPDPFAYVVSANIHRRHLTAVQRRDLIAELLKATPEKSDRQIAETVKASPTTVGTVRAELEQAGDVSNLDTRTDTKGRKQPAAKPKPETHRPAPGHERDKAIVALVALLRSKPLETLDDLIRILRDLGHGIDNIPRHRRIALARGYLAALGVKVDDLSEPELPIAAAEPPLPFEDRMRAGMAAAPAANDEDEPDEC